MVIVNGQRQAKVARKLVNQQIIVNRFSSKNRSPELAKKVSGLAQRIENFKLGQRVKSQKFSFWGKLFTFKVLRLVRDLARKMLPNREFLEPV
ncbi:MAG: hypothetical protein JW953_16030 [Anaerolineae bacterium]|nr:hypothetical protein [Anaerolineae bacterium]